MSLLIFMNLLNDLFEKYNRSVSRLLLKASLVLELYLLLLEFTGSPELNATQNLQLFLFNTVNLVALHIYGEILERKCELSRS
jgi:hypothetical protein